MKMECNLLEFVFYVRCLVQKELPFHAGNLLLRVGISSQTQSQYEISQFGIGHFENTRVFLIITEHYICILHTRVTSERCQ